MKIKHLKLKDFGPHKSLDIDLNSNIVGIIGPNGSGKSNLLQAINYALTGDLNKTNQVKYIRNFGMESGAKKAVVELTFEKGGVEGKITREIGATTSKRCLTWEGEEYHKQDEVDRVLAGIMAADKAVLTNAVFIKQGSIANLIQGTPSERQEIFQKLFHLSFVGKLDQDLMSKIAMLQSGVIDYAPQLTILSEQREALLKEDKELDSSLAQFKDFPEISQRVYDYINAADESSSLAVSYREAGRNLETAQADLRMATAEADKDLNGTSVDVAIADTQHRLQKCLDAERLASDLARAEENYKRCAADANESATRIEQLAAACRSKDADVNALEAQKPQISAALRFITDRKAHDERLRAAKDTLADAVSALGGLRLGRIEAQAAADAKLPGLEKELQRAQLDKKVIKLKQEGLKLGVLTTCPLCGGPISVDHTETEDALNDRELELIASETMLARTIRELTTAANKATADEKAAEIYEQQCRAEVDQATKAAAAYKEWPYAAWPDDEEILAQLFSTIDEAIKEHAEYISKRAVLQEEAKRAEDAKHAAEAILDSQRAALERSGYAGVEALQQAAAKQYELSSTLTKLNSISTKLMLRKEAVTTAALRKNQLESEIRRVQEKVDMTAQLPGVSEYITSWENSSGDTFEITDASRRRALVAAIGEDQGKLDTMTERKRSVVGQVESLDTRISEMLELQRKNDKRIELIHMLQMAREVVGKNGAPRDYCNHVFNQITDVVQELLVQMGANFTVEPDESRPMTYSFVRTDNDDGYSMGQERLSGGQAIRLAMALLIACQQMVLPDVGLLVLDEPSSHIDAEGVANMRDMMLSLNTLLESADMQLILVDHNETLNAAFGKTIQLADLRNE